MKRMSINLTDDDLRAIQIVKVRYGLTNTTAAIRLALRETARQIEIGYLKRNLAEQERRT